MLCKSAECFSWRTSLSTSRGEKSIIIHVFLSFIYWAQKLKKYTVSIELNWNITLFLFHGVIQFSINQITYQYLKHKCIIFFHFRLSRWGSGPLNWPRVVHEWQFIVDIEQLWWEGYNAVLTIINVVLQKNRHVVKELSGEKKTI